MLPFGNPRFAMLAGLLLVAAPLEASNPHTADGADCGPWLASAPLSERIRQVRSCEGVKTSKAMQLSIAKPIAPSTMIRTQPFAIMQ